MTTSSDATSRTADPWSNGQRASVALLLLVHASLAWLTRVPSLTTGHDDAWYLVLARALRQFSYAELPIVGGPAHSMYPPGYPAVLSLLGATGADGVAIAAVANIVLSVCTLWMAAMLAARVSPAVSVATLLVCALNPLLIDHASTVRSEPLYAAATMLALLLFVERRGDGGSGRTAAFRVRATDFTTIFGTLGVIAAALTRSIGVTLVAALCLHLLLARRWRAAAFFVVLAACTVGTWFWWTARQPRGGAGTSYLADATVVYPSREGVRPAREDGASASPAPSPALRALHVGADRVWHHVNGYLRRDIPTALALYTVPGTRVDNALWLLALLVGGGAGAFVFARRARLLVLYLLAYLGLLAVWPYLLVRFVGPIVPLLVLAMLAGGYALAERLTTAHAARRVVWMLAGLMALGAVRTDVARLQRVAHCDRSAPHRSSGCFSEEQRQYFLALETIRRITPEDAVFLGSKEATFHLLTGRRSVRQSEAAAMRDPRAFEAFVQRHRVDYLLLSPLNDAQRALAGNVRANCGTMQLVATFGATISLLQLQRPGSSGGDSADGGGSACDAVTRWESANWSSADSPLW